MTELNHENRDQEDLGKKGIDRFDEEVRYWMSHGASFTEAKNKAIDMYRKHWSREVTSSNLMGQAAVDANGEVDEAEFFGIDSRPTQDVITEMSEMVRRFLEGAESQTDKKYIVILLRGYGLDENLDEDTLDLMESITDAYPVSHKRKDIAEAMGFKVKDNGSTSSMYLIHNRIKENFIELFGGYAT